jgi:hypothetical protein
MGLALASVPLLGWWVVPAVLVAHNLMRLRLTLWGLDLGLHEGLKVGAALERSWLPRAAGDAQRIAAFAVGLGVPVAVGWLLHTASRRTVSMTLGVALIGMVLLSAPATRTRVTGVRLGLGLVVVALMIIGGMQ